MGSKRFLRGKGMEFKAAKVRQRSLPHLRPNKSKQPSIPMLNDDILLKVFEYLPFDSLFIIETVCKRWQGLVRICLRSKVRLELNGKMSHWLKSNGAKINLLSISKILTYSEESMTDLDLREVFISSKDQEQLLRVIARLCPALESLTLSNLRDFISNSFTLRKFVKSCSNMKKFSIEKCKSFDDELGKICMMGWPSLETLQLPYSQMQGNCFNWLPRSLKVLNVSHCYYLKQENLAQIPVRCQLLENLNLDGLEVTSLIQEIGKKCPNIKHLGISILYPNLEVKLSNIKNITSLTYCGYLRYLNTILKSATSLEELRLKGLGKSFLSDSIDFSLLEELRILELPWNKRTRSAASIKSICNCKKLEKLKFQKSLFLPATVFTDFPSAVRIIRCCTSLKEFDCRFGVLNDDNIDSLVEANKGRKHRLKITMLPNPYPSTQLEKLKDSNYDVDFIVNRNSSRMVKSFPCCDGDSCEEIIKYGFVFV